MIGFFLLDDLLRMARSRRPPLPEIVLWTTTSLHPSESQTSECSDLLSRSRATFVIVAQRQPGKLLSLRISCFNVRYLNMKGTFGIALIFNSGGAKGRLFVCYPYIYVDSQYIHWEQRENAGSLYQKFCCGLQHRCIHRSHRRQSAVTCSADREPPS